MAGPISKNAEGLLDFYGLKFTGRNPSALADFIQPTMDISRLQSEFHAVNAVAQGPNIVANTPASNIQVTSAMWLTIGNVDLANGSAVSTVVPVGELWIIEQAAIVWSMFDATNTRADLLATCRSPPGTNYTHVITDGPLLGSSSGAAVLSQGWHVATRPFYLLPGEELRVMNNGIIAGAGAPVIWNLDVRVRRLSR